MENIFNNVVKVSKTICRAKIEKDDLVVDATMGNGNDTAFLCDLVGEKGRVYAFDIQEQALTNTRERLKDLGFEERAELIHDGHENIDKYIREKVSLVIYNLGYLPSADHGLTTTSETTIRSVEKTLDILKQNGLVLLVVYPGHESGLQEKIDLETFTGNLKQKQFNVFNVKFTNQVNNPPELICIEKR